MTSLLDVLYAGSIAFLGTLLFAAVATVIARYIKWALVVVLLLCIIGIVMSFGYEQLLHSRGVKESLSLVLPMMLFIGVFRAGQTYQKYHNRDR